MMAPETKASSRRSCHFLFILLSLSFLLTTYDKEPEAQDKSKEDLYYKRPFFGYMIIERKERIAKKEKANRQDEISNRSYISGKVQEFLQPGDGEGYKNAENEGEKQGDEDTHSSLLKSAFLLIRFMFLVLFQLVRVG
jgi:hypothetical protein